MTAAPSPTRLEKFTSHAIREYESTSVIKPNFAWRRAEADENGGFVKVGQRFLSDGKPFLDEYSVGDEYFVPEIIGPGRSVAIGEENYLMQKLQQFFHPSECASRSQMMSRLADLAEPVLSVAFMPIEYYKDFHLVQTPGMRLEYETGRTFLRVGVHRMRIYWSNRYVKFSQFFFLARDAIEWVIKPDPATESWLQVNVKPARMKRFEVTVETIALCKRGRINHGIAYLLQEKPTDAVFRADAVGLPLEETIIEGFYFEIGELAPGLFRVAAFETPAKPSWTSNPVEPSRIEILKRLFQQMSQRSDYKVEYETPSELNAQGTQVLVRGIRANISKSDSSPVTIAEIEQLIRSNLTSTAQSHA